MVINDPKLEPRLTDIAESQHEPVPAPAYPLVQRGCHLVITGNLPPDYDIVAEIEAAREEREQKILGLRFDAPLAGFSARLRV